MGGGEISPRHVIAVLLGTLLLIAMFSETGAHNPTPNMNHAEHKQIERLGESQARRFGMVDNCGLVKAWEDGTILAYCVYTGEYLTHGPDHGDSWQEYSGRVDKRTAKRAAKLDI
jgi:hypothetical protein